MFLDLQEFGRFGLQSGTGDHQDVGRIRHLAGFRHVKGADIITLVPQQKVVGRITRPFVTVDEVFPMTQELVDPGQFSRGKTIDRTGQGAFLRLQHGGVTVSHLDHDRSRGLDLIAAHQLEFSVRIQDFELETV